MKIEIKLDKLLSGASAGQIGKIQKNIGEEVKVGDILLNIEANKGSEPIKSTVNGTIQEIKVDEGTKVKKGVVLVVIEGNQAEKPKTNFDYFTGMTAVRKQKIEAEITIIGSGPGGYVAAIQAAKLGAKVVLVEKEKIGGTCLNYGCIPTKAMVRSAEVYRNCKESDEYGVFVDNIKADINKIVTRKDNIVKELVQGIDYLLGKNQVKVIKGAAQIKDKNTIEVKSAKEETTITSKNIIIATGSKACQLNIEGKDLENVITSKELLDIKELPNKITIVGGGVIGMEFAFVLSNLDVEVSVVEYMDNILPMLDEDVCEEITKIALEAGIKLYTSSKVESIVESENGECIVSFAKDDKVKLITADKVLMSVGRQPFYEGIGIEKLGVELNGNKRGIKVNDKMQTNIENIYAIGDVTNIMQLAHVASHQGIVAVKNILGEDKKMKYDVIPSAIFTVPEIGMVGISEKAAREKDIDIKVGVFPFAANGKALTLGETKGFVKLIKDNETDRIIGGTIIGPHATDLMSEIAVAIKNKLKAEDIIETIHAHPTTAESLHEAALSLEGGALHFAN